MSQADHDGKSPFGFEELDAYNVARAFWNRIYKLVKLLPSEEKYALGQQMMRAAVSVTNNIAEGHGRYNWQDNTRFCRQARGSLNELVDDINVCSDQGYAETGHLVDLKSDATEVLKLLNGYISYLQKQSKAAGR